MLFLVSIFYVALLYFSCFNKASPSACSSGTYAAPDRMSCSSCPIGYRCPTSTMSSPIQCVNGTYQNETGQVVCLDCPGGHSCLYPENTPIPCNSAEYSPVRVSVCLPCPSGYRYVFVLPLFCSNDVLLAMTFWKMLIVHAMFPQKHFPSLLISHKKLFDSCLTVFNFRRLKEVI